MKLALFIKVLIPFFLIMNSCSISNKPTSTTNTSRADRFMTSLLEGYPQLFDSIINNKEELGVQIIYTQIDRDKDGNPGFRDYSFNLDTGKYFYPASTVKLPVAALALQRLNELNFPGLNKYSTMITRADHSGQTEVQKDSSSADGKPSIAQYIKKILLVSDNDAFNRLYEFLGQEYINNSLQAMGYEDIQIIHRLSIALSEEENRHTNPVRFLAPSGNIIYDKQGEKSRLIYAIRDTKMGKGFMRGDTIVYEPFDFSRKNRLNLRDMHNILRSIIFPEAVPEKQRFNLTPDDYDFLRKYMSMQPRESKFPFYDSSYGDSYVKFLYYGGGEAAADPNIRSFNKPGDAYGFMIDAAYIVDLEKKIEFIISAVIHCNSDGILNDDTYDYKTLGYPFMKNLGRVVYEYELKRKRTNSVDLSKFKFDY